MHACTVLEYYIGQSIGLTVHWDLLRKLFNSSLLIRLISENKAHVYTKYKKKITVSFLMNFFYESIIFDEKNGNQSL